jgi:uncharacterized membrane protein YkvA (DUF1232 family)
MTYSNPGDLIPSSGFITELVLRIKLIWRLMMDKRVNLFLKALPVFSVIYLINPIDLPTPLDDAAIIGLGFTLFIALCPQYIVQEHLNNLRQELPKHPKKTAAPDIIEGKCEPIPEDDSENPG